MSPRGGRLAGERAQIGHAQLRADVGEQTAFDELDRHDDGRAVVERRRHAVDRPDRGGGDHRRQVEQAGDDGGLRMRAAFGRRRLADADAAVQGQRAAAHVVDERRELRLDRRQRGGRHRLIAGDRVERLVLAVQHDDVVMLEKALQPDADAARDPSRIVIQADLLDGGLRGGDALDLAQHALAVAVERARRAVAPRAGWRPGRRGAPRTAPPRRCR